MVLFVLRPRSQARFVIWTLSSVTEALSLFGSRKHHRTTSDVLNHWTSGNLSQKHSQTAEWIPIIPSAVVHVDMLDQAPSVPALY